MIRKYKNLALFSVSMGPIYGVGSRCGLLSASLNICFMRVSCTLNRVPHKQNCWLGRVIKWRSFIRWEKSFIPIKLMWLGYLVYSLGNCVMKLCIETDIIEYIRVFLRSFWRSSWNQQSSNISCSSRERQKGFSWNCGMRRCLFLWMSIKYKNHSYSLFVCVSVSIHRELYAFLRRYFTNRSHKLVRFLVTNPCLIWLSNKTG
jgi:hypothetical protein